MIVTTDFNRLVARHCHPARRAALLLPTTDAALAAAEAAERRHVATIVGSLAGMVRPVDALGLCASCDTPGGLVVFSDQILSCADTPVLVREDGDAAFHSVFEFLLVARHGYDLLAWTGDDRGLAPDGRSLPGVVGMLQRYFLACGRLGDAWRMRDRQVERTVDWRRRTAERAIRSFESAVCLEYCTEPHHPEASRLLGRARALARSIREVRAS
jgi:hypothetical protein